MKILYWPCLLTFSGLLLLGGCQANQSPTNQTSTPQGLPQGLEIKFLVGSALTQFCEQAATQFNQQNPKLEGGQPFYLKCEAKGSGDIVTNVINLAQQLKQGSLQADAPEFPTLISTD